MYIKCYYNDDGILIPGILVKGFLHSTFVTRCGCCGWTKQRITKANKFRLVKRGGQ